MDLQKISEIVNNDDFPEGVKNRAILEVLSADPKVVLYLIHALQYERQQNKMLIEEMNLELSRAQIGLDGKADKNFVLKEIHEFYQRWKSRVRHCFNSNY